MDTVQVERALLTQGDQGQLIAEASDLQLRGWPVWIVVAGLQGPGQQHRFRWVRTERDAEGDTTSRARPTSRWSRRSAPYGSFKKLPAAVEYEGRIYGKSGYNSDRNKAYYKAGLPLARRVK